MSCIQNFFKSCCWCCPTDGQKSDARGTQSKVDETSRLLLNKVETKQPIKPLKMEEKAPIKGFFYEIRDEKNKVRGYLLGTTHLNSPHIIKLNPLINKAIEESQYLAFESDVYEDAKKSMEEEFRKSGIPDNLLSTLLDVSLKLMSQVSMDFAIAYKNKDSKLIKALESPDVAEKIKENLKKQAPSKLTPSDIQFDAIMQNGDIQQLQSFISKATNRFEDWERNPNMANKIDEDLKATPEYIGTFIIGASHFYDKSDGCKGILTHLEEKQWTLQRVIYEESNQNS